MIGAYKGHDKGGGRKNRESKSLPNCIFFCEIICMYAKFFVTLHAFYKFYKKRAEPIHNSLGTYRRQRKHINKK